MNYNYTKYLKVEGRRHTNMAEHKIKSFSSLFLTLYTLLLIDFPNEPNVASPIGQHKHVNVFKVSYPEKERKIEAK